ncbi:MAG: phosphopantothenoylcysteine decarboxylase, partial [Bacteroidetes bacterium HGW-Bacteroidetes-21]
MLKGKHIILGITGSIAAYKAAYLTRLLVKAGADVKIIITPTGKEFITPVTLATLSKNTVLCDFFHHDDGAWNSHIELGLWADLFLVAPASAN